MARHALFECELDRHVNAVVKPDPKSGKLPVCEFFVKNYNRCLSGTNAAYQLSDCYKQMEDLKECLTHDKERYRQLIILERREQLIREGKYQRVKGPMDTA